MPKIGAIVRSYHATQYLPIVLRQFLWVDRLVVLNYRFNQVSRTTDNTKEICDKVYHGDLVYEKGFGYDQHDIFNRGLDILKDFDVAFISDADEIIFPQDQKKIITHIVDRRGLTGQKDYACCNFVDYNGDLHHASPQRQYLVPMAVHPASGRFTHIRSFNNIRADNYPDVTVHHLGLVFTPETIKWKSEWEYKEEGHSQEELLKNWGVRREVTPPPELLELLDE